MALSPDYRTYSPATVGDTAVLDAGLRAYMLRVYNWMSSGLILTGIVAYAVANTSLIDLFYQRVATARGMSVQPTLLGYAAMFGPPGHAYVYRSYGLHWCLNAVCGAEPRGSAVLIRALEPASGLDLMRERRGVSDPRLLCSGPGRLCHALDVTGVMDGQPLDTPTLMIQGRPGPVEVVAGRRIGITRGVETPWRFGLAGSQFLSRPLREAPPSPS